MLDGKTTYSDWSAKMMADIGDLIADIAQETGQSPEDVLRPVHGRAARASWTTEG